MAQAEQQPAAGGRVALVTGAGGGLGRALVAELLAQGWRVAAGYRQPPATATNTAEASLLPTNLAGDDARSLKNDTDGNQRLLTSSPAVQGSNAGSLTLALDVTDRAQCADAVAQTVSHWGRLDLLVNNAGATADRAILQMSEAEWDAVIAVNLKGAFNCAQAALKPMLQQRDGQIVNLSSFAARQGTRGQANYAAAKAGLIALTESLAKEVGGRNIRVNAVLPGVLRTRMTAKLTEEQLAEFARANALGRLNDLAEVARFVVFLAGTQNISGQVFQLDSRVARWT